MLKIIRNMRELDFAQLMQIYEEANRENGEEFYSVLPPMEQILMAEQDFYGYLTAFFKDHDAFYAVWAPEGSYRAALRLEPYRDGLLLEALETKPDERRKGNARALMNEVLSYLRQKGGGIIYSHVHKKNEASLAVHRACGFQKILEHAVYIDGSVLHGTYTFVITV